MLLILLTLTSPAVAIAVVLRSLASRENAVRENDLAGRRSQREPALR